jgi:hypothetical protein
MDRDEMSNLYRGPSIDASYQVSVHLAKQFQRRRLKCEKLTDDGRQVMVKVHISFGSCSQFPIFYNDHGYDPHVVSTSLSFPHS